MGTLPTGLSGTHDQAWRLRALVESLAGERAGAAGVPDRRASTVPIVTIASGKGGVGKTNLAVNLSIAFSLRGIRSTLLDADLGMANADLLCGLSPSRRLDEVLVDGSATLDACAVEGPGGFLLVPGAVGVARVADLEAGRRRLLVEQLARLESRSDVIVIDTGAGIGLDVMAFSEAADWLTVVITPEPTSITDGYGLIKCVVSRARERGAEPPCVAVVVNQASSIADGRRVFGRIVACSRRFLRVEPVLLGVMRHDASVGRSVRRGRPHLLDAPRSRATRDVRRVARAMAETAGL